MPTDTEIAMAEPFTEIWHPTPEQINRFQLVQPLNATYWLKPTESPIDEVIQNMQ
jgi:hypothetical protein